MTPENQADPWVTVAVVLRPHGLDGTFRLKPLTRQADDLIEAGFRQFRLRRKGVVEEAPLVMRDCVVRLGLLYAHFDGITDRSGAEKYTNCELVIRESERWELPEGEYYADDLAGLEARAEDGALLGKVLRADNGAAHDYLILDLIQAPGRETLLPILPEFVPRVDIVGGFVTVRIPEGLLD